MQNQQSLLFFVEQFSMRLRSCVASVMLKISTLNQTVYLPDPM